MPFYLAIIWKCYNKRIASSPPLDTLNHIDVFKFWARDIAKAAELEQSKENAAIKDGKKNKKREHDLVDADAPGYTVTFEQGEFLALNFSISVSYSYL
jgi:hypothetical protein